MLERARKKSGAIEWVQGDAMALPFGDGEFDAVTVGFGVRNLEDLGSGLAELARVLRPGGRLLISDMLPHDREIYRQQMGHVWLGFSEETLGRLLAQAGFDRVRVAHLPVDPDAKGPALFVASARLKNTD